MVMEKKRHYNEIPVTNLGTIYAPPVAPLNVMHEPNPFVTTASYLRLRCQFYMDVRIGTPDPPPSIWWSSCTVTLVAFWTPSGSSTVGNSVGTSEHYLGSQLLTPTLTMDPQVATDYAVQWKQTEDMVLETARADTSTVSASINIGIVVYDPYTALQGTWASVGIDYNCRLFTLWGRNL